MNDDAAKRFGDQVKGLREDRGLSSRGLARRAGLTSGAIVRIEQGKVCQPHPETLKRMAEALEVPLADVFAMAGYVTPSDLPSLSYYLRIKYGYLPAEVCDRVEEYVRRLVEEHQGGRRSAAS